MVPIVMLAGGANAGKDTVAGFIAKDFGAACLAIADPMKRFCRKVFGFTEEQLWGPSAARNQPDDRFDEPAAWLDARFNFQRHARGWVREVTGTDDTIALHGWFTDLFKLHVEEYLGDPPGEGYGRATHYRVVKRLTPRYPLQTIGEEWGRRHFPNMWKAVAMDAAFKLLGGGYRYERAEGLVRDRASAPPPPWAVITDGRIRDEILEIQRRGGRAVRVVDPTGPSSTQDAGVPGHSTEQVDGIPDHFFTGTFYNHKSAGLHACEGQVEVMMRAFGSTPSWGIR